MAGCDHIFSLFGIYLHKSRTTAVTSSPYLILELQNRRSLWSRTVSVDMLYSNKIESCSFRWEKHLTNDIVNSETDNGSNTLVTQVAGLFVHLASRRSPAGQCDRWRGICNERGPCIFHCKSISSKFAVLELTLLIRFRIIGTQMNNASPLGQCTELWTRLTSLVKIQCLIARV